MSDNVRHPTLSLPFVQEITNENGENILDFWAVTSTGNWSKDNQQGREYAEVCIDYMIQHDATVFLGNVVKAMNAKNSYSGIEVGFFAAIAEQLVC